ncbi:hypothetical protein LOK49_LG13G01189 [Camellia lanceoleosa]|uniref:Uncharacterized protein n=1 Tax=Camellia lanceoleosa TaxID=1840588 RepID=A0ACC0FFR6_9ERIC|nr:hypothetical protein LOK49_LG13G01189 [Camellia lanceoleosa]
MINNLFYIEIGILMTNGTIIDDWNWDFEVWLSLDRQTIEVVELARGDTNMNDVSGINGGGGRPKEDKDPETKSKTDSTTIWFGCGFSSEGGSCSVGQFGLTKQMPYLDKEHVVA